jgi:hypothetical protein
LQQSCNGNQHTSEGNRPLKAGAIRKQSILNVFGIASFRNPRAECSCDLVKLSELGLRQGLETVLGHEDLQLVAGVNTPGLGAGWLDFQSRHN